MFQTKNITLNFWNRTDRFIRDFRLAKKKDRILLALSGGPDSMALFHYLVKRRKDLDVTACHVNHGIRGAEAEQDLRFVKKACEKAGVRFIGKRINVPEMAKREGKSVEHAARNARYSFLFRTARREKCPVIFTAHHSDDNAETFLLNLLRGASARSLRGIPVKRRVSKSLYVARPLLWAGKTEILLYLKANGASYRRDRSNEDEKYTRNWIRKTLLPLLERKQPRFREHLAAITEELGETGPKTEGPCQKYRR